MAIEPQGNQRETKLPSDFGQRAAMALDDLLPPQHRDKTVARLFDVSVRFAKYLRRGQHWTINRLDQASKVIEGFDICLASPKSLEVMRMEMDELEKRLARLEQERLAEDARGSVALRVVENPGPGPGASPTVRGVVRQDEAQAAPLAARARR